MRWSMAACAGRWQHALSDLGACLHSGARSCISYSAWHSIEATKKCAVWRVVPNRTFFCAKSCQRGHPYHFFVQPHSNCKRYKVWFSEPRNTPLTSHCRPLLAQVGLTHCWVAHEVASSAGFNDHALFKYIAPRGNAQRFVGVLLHQ